MDCVCNGAFTALHPQPLLCAPQMLAQLSIKHSTLNLITNNTFKWTFITLSLSGMFPYFLILFCLFCFVLWCLTLIFISLMAKGAEHLFHIFISYLRHNLAKSPWLTLNTQPSDLSLFSNFDFRHAQTFWCFYFIYNLIIKIDLNETININITLTIPQYGLFSL